MPMVMPMVMVKLQAMVKPMAMVKLQAMVKPMEMVKELQPQDHSLKPV